MKIVLSVALSVLSSVSIAAETPAVPNFPPELLLDELEDDSVAEVVEDDSTAEVPVFPTPQPTVSAIKQPPPPADPMIPYVIISDPAKEMPAAAGEERDMTPDELAALEAIKPAQPEQTPEPPQDLADAPELLTPTYAALAKRSPEGDWVTAQFKQPTVPREQTRVAVLGYHDFSNTKSSTEMRMKTAEFCRQMQFLKDSDICVISMQDFLEWRFGTRCLPEKCVLITIDDGWKTVYSDAYPVLKAYGYPFTLFVYVRYIGVQGSSMTPEQIKEMQQYGATIGSHSWNHYYPSKWKAHQPTSETYTKMLQKELVDSRTKLKEWFGNCSTFCYPGGYHTASMRDTLKSDSCEAAFTVIENKVKCDVEPYLINRYMVFGNDTSIFRRAVNFAGQEGVDPTITAINAAESPAREFLPSAFSGIESPLVQNEQTAAEKAAAAKATEEAAADDAEATAAGDTDATEVIDDADTDAPEVPHIIQDPSAVEQPVEKSLSTEPIEPVVEAPAPVTEASVAAAPESDLTTAAPTPSTEVAPEPAPAKKTTKSKKKKKKSKKKSSVKDSSC